MDRKELGSALRGWRERLRPSDVGLPAGSRRRTPGLRREEVARLADVSVDYLTRLEQGRGPKPSDSVISGLSRALRLADTERDHLFHLAGTSPPAPDRIRSAVRPSVQRLMDRFTDLPVLLMDAKAEVLAWNPMAEALLGDLSAIPPAERNIARQAFAPHLGPSRVEGDVERLQRAIVADLRRAAARYPDDPGMHQLVSDLRSVSPRFAELWEQRVLDDQHDNHKTIRHPELGPIDLDCDVLQIQGDDQILIVYSAAPGTLAAQVLDLLRVIGLQHLGTTPGRDLTAEP